MLVLNDELVVLAADIHPRQVTVAMIDLNGRLLSRSTLPLGPDPSKAVCGMIDCMQRIRTAIPKSLSKESVLVFQGASIRTRSVLSLLPI